MPKTTLARFLPWFRNNGQAPQHKREAQGDDWWFTVRNRADRRAARSRLTVLAQQTRRGTRPRTSPGNAYRGPGADRPRVSVVLRRQARELRAQGYPEQTIKASDREARAALGVR
jgi:hypothetical protein